MRPIAALLLGLFAQAVVVYIAIAIAPGVSVSSFWWALFAAWFGAILIDPRRVGRRRRRGRRSAGRDDAAAQPAAETARPQRGRPGVLFVQIDGLSAPLLTWMITAGNLPTLSRWIRDDTHRLVEWHTGIPSTTPASQAGILHGGAQHVPAFRWYEKETGRLVVTNRTGDAAYVEQHHERRRRPAQRRRRQHQQRLLRRRRDLGADLQPGLAEEPDLARVGDLPGQSERAVPCARPDGRRDGQGALPGPSATSPRRPTPDPARRFLRRAAGRHQRPAARAEHRAHRRADGPRRPGHLLRLRRLRRGRPPRRPDPSRVARRPAGSRPGHRPPRTPRHGRAPPVPDRGDLRPRSEPGRDLQAAVRRDVGGGRAIASCRARSPRPRTPSGPRSGVRSTRC